MILEKNSIVHPSKAERKDCLKKLPYERPQLGSIRLFADQVLGHCRFIAPCMPIAPIKSWSIHIHLPIPNKGIIIICCHLLKIIACFFAGWTNLLFLFKKASFYRILSDDDKKFIVFCDGLGHVDIHIKPCRKEHLCRDVTRKIFTQQRMTFCRTEDGYVQLFFPTENTPDPFLGISVDFDFSKFNYYIHDEAKEEVNPCKLASNIFLLQHSFINHHGLIIHAAGGSIYGKGIAFAAPSRTGKSTLSRLLLFYPHRIDFSVKIAWSFAQ